MIFFIFQFFKDNFRNALEQNGAAFDEMKDVENEEKTKSNIPIYNYVCSPEKPITWRKRL